jgi:hypothetical protein
MLPPAEFVGDVFFSGLVPILIETNNEKLSTNNSFGRAAINQ